MPPIGVCFEPLEPRLLLSGSWGAGVDAPSHDSQTSTHGGFTQETVVVSEITIGSAMDTQHQNPRQTAVQVDLLAQASVLNAVNAADPVLEKPSTTDQAAPATGNTSAIGTESDCETQPELMAAAGIRELVFINENIADYQQLIADLQGGDDDRIIEVVVLDADRDGIEQVSEILSERSDLAAVHFITHGDEGQINLGNTWLNSETLKQNSTAVTGWGDALSETGDILFYGCDIAADGDGHRLLNDIAALTGADVAASNDLTGNAKMGGDWELEYGNGKIETNVAFSPETRQNWSGVLATFNVTTTNDGGPGSLRQAVIDANALAGADEIVVGAGNYLLSLTGTGENAAAIGDLDITEDVTITGAGANTTVIDGADADRVFEILGSNVTISGITIQNGSASDGGGIWLNASSSLTLRDAAVSDNHATNTGGGILVSGLLTLDRATVEGNSADVGGGIFVNNGASATLINTTFSGNSAASNGGAIFTRNAVDITNSTIADNTAAAGAGGIHKAGSGNASLKNTILANNTGGNANGALISLGNNIDSQNTAGLMGPGDQIMTDPLLGVLKYNGGPTKTYALLTGSPAIDAGTATGAPTVDQRGVSRLGATDIGAYEYSVIGYEPFAYAAGPFNGANGGTGWAAGWSNVGMSTTVTATGLQDPTGAMPVSGGAAELRLLSYQTVTQSRNLSTTLGAPGSTAWISFLVKPDGTAAGDYAGIEFGSPSASIAFAGYTNGRFVLEQAGGAGTVMVNGISPTAGQTYLLTVRMDFAAGADALTLYVNPTPGQAAPDSTFTATKADLNLGSFTRIAIAGGESWMDNDAALDELRISSSYLDAVPMGGRISGTLFHDMDGDADITEAGTLRFAGATVRLYKDNGSGTPGTGDTLVATTSTNASGQYAFNGLTDGDYWVVVDSKTLGAAGYNGGYAADDVWADQTYGAAGAMQGSDYLSNSGALYGGRYANTSDNASTLATSEHITRVSVAGGEVTGVDAGFSFSAVVNTRGDTTDDDGVASGRLQQGSLRQFLINSNAIGGTQAANFSVGTGAITIMPTAAMPTLADAVVLDGTTQEGFAGAPVVELNGSIAGSGVSGFVLSSGASGSTIRGFVLNRFGGDTIHLFGSDDNLIAGNYLGTDVSGMTDQGAGGSGVLLTSGASGNRIGGTTTADRNVISGNNYAGIAITGSGTDDNLIQGNLIGTAVDGIGALGNSAFGVVIWDGADGNQVGGAVAGEGNVIANSNRGVIVDANFVNSLNNAILGNRILNNTALGIDLYPAGVRTNDLGDGDGGPNNYQNYPVLASARTDDTQINLAGTLNSTANTSFRIEFFASATGDASGHGEAERYLGFVNVTTDASGNASFDTWLTTTVAVGESISATATRANAGFTSFFDTSEFALNIATTPLNSAPVNTLPGPMTAAEDATIAITGLSVSDVDGNLSSVQLSVANGVLNLSVAGGATISSGANNSASVTLTGTQTQLNAALATLTYAGGADFNGADVLSVLSSDGPGLSDTDTLAITVNPVNDAPVLSGANNLTTISEDPAGNPGTLVSALIAGQTSDVDAGALTGIAVTAANNTNGSWQYSTNSGTTWNAFGSPSNASARLLAADADTYVRFVPNANWNGTVAGGLTFRAWDRTIGSAGSTANTTTNGGTSAFSAATAGAGITVDPVNDAPAGLPSISGTPTENQTLTAVTSGISDADGLGVFSYQWLRNGTAITGATASTYTLGDVDVGAQISVRVSYTDGHGTNESVTSAQTAAVANVNDAPVGLPTITGTATEDQTLAVVTGGISDADGLGVFSYQWLRNGIAITGATASTYTLDDVDVDTQISIRVSYTDGHGTNESVTSAQTAAVVNVNDAPVGLPTITGTATEDQTLAVVTGGISDADGLGAFSYQWLRDSVAITGATNSTYTLGDADVGTQISVRVSYTDGHGTLESLTSAQSAAVANVNDIPTGLPVITGSATKGQTLTAITNGIDDEDGLGAFNYQWLRDGAAITGATTDTYVLGNDDVSTLISVQVSYTDGRGTAESVTSSPVGPIANVNDAPVGLPAITGMVTEDQTLTADVSGIADADGLGVFSYQWLRDGTIITGATASTYTLGDADVATEISLQVSYTDGHGTHESLTSAAVGPVANVNDNAAGLPVIIGTVAEDQTLAAEPSGISDPDGLGAFSYRWLRNGMAITGATNSSYTLSDADVGSQISVTVSYTDGHGTFESLTSAPAGPVANVNDAPVGLPNISGTITEDQTLIAVTSGITDADGLGTLVCQWQRDGADISGATGSTYTLGDADVGTQISVQVSYTDGHGTLETLASAPTAAVANVNDAPTGLPTITGTTAEDQTLTADVSGISDTDGLSVFSYQWLRNGSAITGATASSFTLSDADVGTQISVQVGYIDGQGTSESLTSVEIGPVANVNDAPIGLPVITGTTAEDQTLTTDVSGISDADGLGVFSYQWLRNGVDITGAIAGTYTLGDTDVGAQISVQVSYTDHHGTNESLTSATVGPVANVNDLPIGSVTISGTPTEDQILTAGNTLADADGMGAVSYQWQRDGVDIAGATGATHTLGDADVGAVITVAAGYTDAQGTSESVASAGVGPVGNVNDLPTGSVTISGTPGEDQTLTASNTLADADGLGVVSYQWRRNGVDVTGATGATYTLGDADVGAVITVVAGYTDAQGTSESVISAGVGPVANVNDLPTGSVTISGTPGEDQILTASNTLSDADGLGSVSYQWQRDGVDIAGATGATHTLGDADVGTVITVVAGYTDGQGTSESVTSAGVGPVANVNDAPSGSVTISGVATEDQTLTASNTLADADGMGTVSYQWQRNGVDITAATGVTYTPGDADVGAVITVVAGYTDGQGTNESVVSAGVGPVANVNDTPTGSVIIDNMIPVAGDTLTASNTLVDADGLSGAISYQWQRNAVDIAGATGATYTTVQSDVGTVISVVASYTDDRGTIESRTSAGTAPVAHLNVSPTVSNLNTAEAYTEDIPLDLTNIVVTDVDSANVTVTLTLIGSGRRKTEHQYLRVGDRDVFRRRLDGLRSYRRCECPVGRGGFHAVGKL